MPSLFFDPKTNGFHGSDVGGCVEITALRKAELMDGQALGKPVGADANGQPINVEPPQASNENIEGQRRRAYADPITGSDRFFAEAARMQLSGEPGYAEVQQAGLARYAEIKNEYPMGVN